jgi:hypothetical protein
MIGEILEVEAEVEVCSNLAFGMVSGITHSRCAN